MLTLIVVCVSVLVCFKGIAWVARNGWRSMLGVVALRGEAVVEWQDCDKRDRHAWDSHVSDAVLLTRERTEEEETNEDAADFLLWADELAYDKAIAKHLRRMERWSR